MMNSDCDSDMSSGWRTSSGPPTFRILRRHGPILSPSWNANSPKSQVPNGNSSVREMPRVCTGSNWHLRSARHPAKVHEWRSSSTGSGPQELALTKQLDDELALLAQRSGVLLGCPVLVPLLHRSDDGGHPFS